MQEYVTGFLYRRICNSYGKLYYSVIIFKKGYILITEFVLSEEFSSFASVIGLITNIVVLILAGYTLYIIAFSKEVVLVSPSFNTTMFYGDQISLTLMNKSLHAIPVQKVFILKQYEARFYYIIIAECSEPVTIDSWSVKRLETGPFTGITSWKGTGWLQDQHEILIDSVIGIEAGTDLIWVKPYDKNLLYKAKKAYNQFNYQKLSVFKKKQDDVVLSHLVDCVIYVKMIDINGQFYKRRFFGITGCNHGNNVFLDEPLCGYNSLLVRGNTPEAISKAIQEQIGISKENIIVYMIERYNL